MTLSGNYGSSCYHSHPALHMPGSSHVINGGSCCSPSVTDADVYIGFDYGMTFTGRHLPWRAGDEFLFSIPDGKAPRDADSFRQLVEWTKEQMQAGRKVHCGCIGGHGRTGTFLAALASLYGCADAIGYVRKLYCDRAVESEEQVDFLAKHYGVTPRPGSHATRDPWKRSRRSGFSGLDDLIGGNDPWQGSVVPLKSPSKAIRKKASKNVIEPLRGRGSLWD